MAILFIRCLVLYGLVLAAMKLMGKRQLGQLQPFELVAILIISVRIIFPFSPSSRRLMKPRSNLIRSNFTL